MASLAAGGVPSQGGVPSGRHEVNNNRALGHNSERLSERSEHGARAGLERSDFAVRRLPLIFALK